MNVLILNGGDDTGSVAIRIKNGFDRYAPGWNVRCVRSTDNYALHQADLTWNNSEVPDLFSKADVVHWMERLMPPEARWLMGLSKPAVLHHHGEIYRDELVTLQSQARSMHAVEIVSTIDLLSIAPGPTWLPAPYDLDMLRAFRVDERHNVPRVFHSPTVRERKGTEFLEAAVEALGVDRIELEMVMYKPQDYVYQRKGKADIVFDNMYGYGLNAVEAMGMGLPVIGGLVESRFANPQVRNDIMREVGYIPFFEVNTETLKDGLGHLADSPHARSTWAERGAQYVHDFHDERKVVERLKLIYQQAIDQYGVTA